MRACDVMRSSFAVIKPNALIIEAVRLLLQNNQRCIPVLNDDGDLVGVVSEGDLLHRDELEVNPTARNWLKSLLGGSDLVTRKATDGLNVNDVMSRSVVCVDEEADLGEVVSQMDRHRIGQVLVACGEKVIGIVSRVELMVALERELGRVSKDKVGFSMLSDAE